MSTNYKKEWTGKSPFNVVENIFNSLLFPNASEYSYAIVHENYQMFNDYYEHLYNNSTFMEGGGVCKYDPININFLIKNKKITLEFNCVKHNDRIEYVLSTKDKVDCAVVFITDKPKLAYIANLNNYEGCITNGLLYPKGGSIILNAILSMLKTYKKKFRNKQSSFERYIK